MKKSLFVPKVIHVGYQERSDTYTGKLAYVIYTDDKGKKRKETSWEGWRDHKIEPNDFENVPTEGFVLNKKVGDYDTGWNHRHAWCRVYDPRNFEFEISIENLLYILENTSSIKGKGLEGEFVYGWDGKDLVLLPVDTLDYKEISEFNKKVFNNECIKAKDLKVGATYITKEKERFVYMGRYNYYDDGYEWTENGQTHQVTTKNKLPEGIAVNSYLGRNAKNIAKHVQGVCRGQYHWFCDEKRYREFVENNRSYRQWVFYQWKSISKNKFVDVVDESVHPEYSSMFDELEKYYKFSPYDPSKDEIKEFSSFDEFKKLLYGRYYGNDLFLSKISGQVKCYQLEEIFPREEDSKYTIKEQIHDYEYDYLITHQFGELETVEKPYRFYSASLHHTTSYRRLKPMTLEYIFEHMKPMYLQKYLANGKEYETSMRLSDNY